MANGTAVSFQSVRSHEGQIKVSPTVCCPRGSVFDGIAPLAEMAQQRTRESRHTSRFPDVSIPRHSLPPTRTRFPPSFVPVSLYDLVPMLAARYQIPRPCVDTQDPALKSRPWYGKRGILPYLDHDVLSNISSSFPFLAKPEGSSDCR